MSKTFNIKLVSRTHTEKDYINDIIKSLRGDDEVITEELETLLQDVEGLMAYTARVSSPKQTNPKFAHLLKYCMNHNHWSVFEMVDASFEIETSRAISAQILRHWSFRFQEFSQRYAAIDQSGVKIYMARRQDVKNRQNSIDDLSDAVKAEWESRQNQNWKDSFEHYQWALDNEIAKESARMVLPLATSTRLYMKGSVRSWLHYIDTRTNKATQQEHKEIASAIRDKFVIIFPIIAEAKGWINEEMVKNNTIYKSNI